MVSKIGKFVVLSIIILKCLSCNNIDKKYYKNGSRELIRVENEEFNEYFEFYENDTIKLHYFTVNSKKEEISHGFTEEFYSNGILKYIYFENHGVMEGKAMEFSKESRLIQTDFFDSGRVIEKRFVEYYDNKKKILFAKCNDNNIVLYSKLTFIDSVLESNESFHYQFHNFDEVCELNKRIHIELLYPYQSNDSIKLQVINNQGFCLLDTCSIIGSSFKFTIVPKNIGLYKIRGNIEQEYVTVEEEESQHKVNYIPIYANFFVESPNSLFYQKIDSTLSSFKDKYPQE